MPTVLLFTNPISGQGRGRRMAARLERGLSAEGYAVSVYARRADRIARDEIPADAVAAIVVGGDGTLRGVAGALLDPGGAAPPPLLVVPLGTANLMGKHLGIDWDERRLESQIVAALRQMRVVSLDAATANGHLMLLVAGVGLDAHVVHELDKRRSGPISYLSYALPAWNALESYDYSELEVSVDGARVFGPAPGVAFVGNVAEYGTGFPILPAATPTDGLLDVCVLPCRSREELLGHGVRAAVGEHLRGEGVVYVKGRGVRVTSASAVPVQIDGEAAGHTPLDIALLPARLRFIVP